MAGTSKVDLFAAIRRDARVEQLSIRAVADKYNVHRRTVREALESPWLRPRKKLARSGMAAPTPDRGVGAAS
jgi:hypothetical protein